MHRLEIRALAAGFLVIVGCLPAAYANTQLGHGLTKCGDYIQLRQQHPDFGHAFDAWVLGHLRGVNFIIHTSKGIDLLADQSSEKISAFVQTFC